MSIIICPTCEKVTTKVPDCPHCRIAELEAEKTRLAESCSTYEVRARDAEAENETQAATIVEQNKRYGALVAQLEDSAGQWESENKALREAVRQAYHTGHDHTVEGCFLWCDEGSQEVADEIIKEALLGVQK